MRGRWGALLCWSLSFVGVVLGEEACPWEVRNGGLFAHRVIQRPSNRILVTTEGSATSNVAEVQEVRLWNHQAIDLVVSGSAVTGGTFEIEFCDFDVRLPGTVDFAPLPGESSDKSLIIVRTEEGNVTKAWREFGVYTGFPIRISTDRSTATQGRETYRIFYSKCGETDCNGVTIKLDRTYDGVKIEGTHGAAWGCSWTLAENALPFNAAAKAIKSTFEKALGDGTVEEVRELPLQNADGFHYRILLAKGTVGVHGRIKSENLRGESLDVSMKTVNLGSDLGESYNNVNWGGSFRLAFQGERTGNVAPSTTAFALSEMLRGLSKLGPDLEVQRDTWTWQVTFHNEVGNVPELEPQDVQIEPVGATIKVVTTRGGKARLEGEFELKFGGRNRFIAVAASASSLNLRNLLEAEFGLQDVSVRRTGPTASNGYQWEIVLSGDCPNLFNPANSTLFVVPTCAISIEPGPRTKETLLGNDATLTVSELIAADLTRTWNNIDVTWSEVSRTPTTLPRAVLRDGLFVLPLAPQSRGQYVFEAKRLESSTVVGTQIVYVDASPPIVRIDGPEAVSFPTDWMELDGSRTEGTYGSSISSYGWRLQSKPNEATNDSGDIVQDNSATTVIKNLDVPGAFAFQLEAKDSLGIIACGTKKVEVLFAPAIVTPLEDRKILPGETLEILCEATGSKPLTFSWKFKEFVLDRFEAKLSLKNVDESDEGEYSCLVSNSVGNATSNVVFIEVYDPVTIEKHPQSTFAVPGSSAKLLCEASGSLPLRIVWERRLFAGGGANDDWKEIQDKSYPNDQEAFELTVSTPEESDQGEYRCRVSNLINTVSSRSAFFEVMDTPSNVLATLLPASALENGVDEGLSSTFQLNCEADGREISFRWTRNGEFFGAEKEIRVQDPNSLDHTGDYVCEASNGAGSAISNTLMININTLPVITVEPFGFDANPGQERSLIVSALGAKPLFFLWMKNGQFLNEEEATFSELNFPRIGEGDEGSYKVVVYNRLGHTESVEVNLTVRDPPKVTFPESDDFVLRVDPGKDATVRCEASGSPILTFQWLESEAKDGERTRVIRGQERAGGDWAELLLSDVENHRDERFYFCEANNDLGTAHSLPIFLEVNDPPSILKHPENVFADPKSSVTLSVEAIGAEPLLYEWRKDGIPLENAFSKVLVLRGIGQGDEGNYDCRVTNHLSSIRGALSRTGFLKLARAPSITKQPRSITVADPGKEGKISVLFDGAPPMDFSWKKGKKIRLQNSTNEPVFESEVVFHSLTQQDEGEYRFIVSNRLGSVTSDMVLLKVNDPPQIITESVTHTVDPGAEIQITCEVEADPEVNQVVWKHRHPLSDSPFPVVVSGETNMILQLSQVSQSEEGDYFCKAQNSAGEAEKKVATLEVRDPPTILRIDPVNQGNVLAVDPFQRIRLTAVVTGLEPMTFEWIHDGESASKGVDKPSFTFNPANDGYIFVRITNQLGEDVSIPIEIRLNQPAIVHKVTIQPPSGRVVPRGFAELSCEVAGTAPFEIIWRRDGEQILKEGAEPSGNSSMHIFQTAQNKSKLQILDAKVGAHSGKYQCVVSNSANPAGNVSETIEVTVVQQPVVEKATPQDATHFPGVNATFTCQLAAGTPPYLVRWYFTKSLEDGSSVETLWNTSNPERASVGPYVLSSVDEELELIVLETEEGDQGLYRCEVCNEAGCGQSRWANLGVYDSPRIVEQIPSTRNAELLKHPGDSFEISIVASGLEPLSFKWTWSGGDLELDGNRVRTDPESCYRAGQPCKLIVSNLKIEDEGEFTCIVSNELGTTSSVRISLTMTRPPKLVDLSTWPGTLETACPGNIFEQNLLLQGTEPIRIRWFFASEIGGVETIFTQHGPFSESYEPYLRIDDPSFANEGFYAFIADNVAGEYRSSVARLEVNEGPTAAADANGPSPRHPVTLPQTFTRLYGTASKNAVSFSWEVISHPELPSGGLVRLLTPRSASTDVVGLDVAGSYAFALTVVGTNGCISSDTVTVTVNTAPVALVRNRTVSLNSSRFPALDASKSFDVDPEGSVVRYSWRVVTKDGSSRDVSSISFIDATAPIAVLSSPSVGLYEILLSVWDNDGGSSSLRAFLNILEVSFMSPDLQSGYEVPFVLGNCFEHLITVQIDGYLPWGSDTLIELRVAYPNQRRQMIQASKLKDFAKHLVTDGVAQIDYPWRLSGTLPVSKQARLEVLLSGDLESSLQSKEFEIHLPFYFRSEKWSSCNCEGIRTREVNCFGFGTDAAFSGFGESCSWVERQHDVSKCKEFGNVPKSVQSCERSVCSDAIWFVGDWDSGTGQSKHDFCAARRCGSKRNRKLQCINRAGNEVAESLCNGKPKPSSEQKCFSGCRAPALLRKGVLNSDGLCFAVVSPEDLHALHCIDRKSGFLLGNSSCSDIVEGEQERLPQPCDTVWLTSTWECNRTANVATRHVQCVQSPSLVEAPDNSCEGGLKPDKISSCFEPQPKNRFHWRIGAWGECKQIDRESNASMIFARERAVLCINSVGETTSDGFCNPRKPKSVEPCVAEECQGTCMHGRCRDGKCICDRGFSGEICNAESEEEPPCSDGLFPSITGGCCTKLSKDGSCCPSNILDFEGKCCARGILDACGVCGGDSKFVDILGKCCRNALDAEGICCNSGMIDRCGVCNGNGLSCFATVKLSGRFTSNRTFEDFTEDQKTHHLENEMFELLAGNLGAEGIKVDLAVSEENQRRELASELPGFQFKAKLSVLPSNLLPLQHMDNPGTWNYLLSGRLSNTTTVSLSNAEGMCGNGVCELGERCTRQGDECCPFDCEVASAVLHCPSDCSGHGKCYPASGRCDCFTGYAGEYCNQCSSEAREVEDGDCALESWIASAAATTIIQDNSASISSKTKFWPGFLFAIFVILIIIAVAFFLFRKYEEKWQQRYRARVRSLQEKGPIAKSLSKRSVSPIPTMINDWDLGERGESKTQGWLWKKSRAGIDGEQVWQQWFTVIYLDSNDLVYLETDPNTASSKNEHETMERGRIRICDIVEVILHENEGSGYYFDFVMTGKKKGKIWRRGEKVDVLDYPQIKERLGSERTERHEWMCSCEKDFDLWVLTFDSFDHIAVRRARGNVTNRSSKSIQSERGSFQSDEGFQDEVLGVQTLVVGSFSGSIGFKVNHEGWIRHARLQQNVYGVLFPEKDEFSIFETMSEAKDGAHHFVGQMLSIPLKSVSGIVIPEDDSKMIAIKYQNYKGKRRSFKFVTATKAKNEWINAFRDHMRFRHGKDVFSGSKHDEARSAFEQEVTLQIGSPQPPPDLATINEPFSSLKLRRNSSFSVKEESNQSEDKKLPKRSSMSALKLEPKAESFTSAILSPRNRKSSKRRPQFPLDDSTENKMPDDATMIRSDEENDDEEQLFIV